MPRYRVDKLEELLGRLPVSFFLRECGSRAHKTERAHAILDVDLHAALVQSVADFVEICPQMLHRDVMVHSHDRALQNGPCALDGIGVNFASDILLGLVSHRLVLVGQALQPDVCAVLVRVDRAAVQDVLEDLSLLHVSVRGRHGHSHDLPVPLAHSQHWLLANRPSTQIALPGLVLVGFLSTDVLLVGLDHAGEKSSPCCRRPP